MAVFEYDNISDKEFMRILFEKYYYGLFGLAVKMTGSVTDAEEVISVAFEHLIAKVKCLRGLELLALEKYVVTTVKHTVYKMNRSKKIRLRSMDDISDYVNPEEELIRQCDIDEVANAILQLSEDDRVIVKMKYYFEMSDEEIALKLGIKESSVRSKLSRVRQKIHRMLETN